MPLPKQDLRLSFRHGTANSEDTLLLDFRNHFNLADNYKLHENVSFLSAITPWFGFWLPYWYVKLTNGITITLYSRVQPGSTDQNWRVESRNRNDLIMDVRLSSSRLRHSFAVLLSVVPVPWTDRLINILTDLTKYQSGIDCADWYLCPKPYMSSIFAVPGWPCAALIKETIHHGCTS